MSTFSTVLSALAALLIAFVGLPFYSAININNHKATGMAALAGMFYGNLVSPRSWLFAGIFFTLFFVASQTASKPLRILLFWTPVTIVSILVIGIFSLYAYMWMHFRNG